MLCLTNLRVIFSVSLIKHTVETRKLGINKMSSNQATNISQASVGLQEKNTVKCFF